MLCRSGSWSSSSTGVDSVSKLHRSFLLASLLSAVLLGSVFAIVQAPPGDFLTSYAATLASSGSSVNLEQLEALRQQYGLDQPIPVQYARWIANVVQGDLIELVALLAEAHGAS